MDKRKSYRCHSNECAFKPRPLRLFFVQVGQEPLCPACGEKSTRPLADIHLARLDHPPYNFCCDCGKSPDHFTVSVEATTCYHCLCKIKEERPDLVEELGFVLPDQSLSPPAVAEAATETEGPEE